jgi:hypothetical protein
VSSKWSFHLNYCLAKILRIFLIPTSKHASRPVHITLLYFINLINYGAYPHVFLILLLLSLVLALLCVPNFTLTLRRVFTPFLSTSTQIPGCYHRSLKSSTLDAVYTVYCELLKVSLSKLQIRTDKTIAGLYLQSPRNFTRQPSVRVSQTLRSSHLSHTIAAAK